MEDDIISKKLALRAAMTANILECYDFTLFLFFSPLFSKLFFPAEDANAALLMTYATFAIGFIVRPIGAVVFGYIGDRFGRKNALAASISFMALPALLIGFLPSYQTIGIAAPIMLALFRLMQGFSVSGEFIGSVVFMIEHEGVKKAGLVSGLVGITASLGQLIASIIAVILVLPGMPDWGWRCAFIFGAFLGVLGAYIRYRLDETPDFRKAMNERRIPSISPLLDILKNNSSRIFLIMGAVCVQSMITYTLLGTVGFSLRKSFPDSAKLYHSLAIAITIFVTPLVGIIGDKTNRREFIFLASIFAVIVFAYPSFYMLNSGVPILGLCGAALVAVLMSCVNGNLHAVCTIVFPVHQRYTGVSLSSNLGMALFGGTVVYVNEFLVIKTESLMAPAYYLMFGAAISFISVFNMALLTK